MAPYRQIVWLEQKALRTALSSEHRDSVILYVYNTLLHGYPKISQYVTYRSNVLYSQGGNIPLHFHLVISTYPECLSLTGGYIY